MVEGSSRAGLAAGAVVLLGLLTYLPALNNPFIADDYAFLSLSHDLERDWGALGDFPLGWRRLFAHLFFYLCYSWFGLHPGPYYAANLLLHLVNAGLVFLLARELSGDRRVGLVAALFFTAYERHQEPVFWISAAHELLLSAGVLASIFLFARFRRSGRRAWYALALASFAASLLTKESFLVALPLLLLVDFCGTGARPAGWWRAQVPFWLLGGAYVVAMFAGPLAYPFSGTGSGLSVHFFEVYGRSLHRLLLFVWVFLLLAWLAYRFLPGAGRFREVLGEKRLWFFLGWLLVTPVPYSFVLYVDYLSSRHTYVPSVGVAGLVGLLFVRGWERAGRGRWRAAGAALLGLCLVANMVHVWRKDAAYRERAAPTEALIAVLNRRGAEVPPGRPIVLYGFPYPQIIARGAAQFFTPVSPSQVFVREAARAEPSPQGSLVFRWDSDRKTLVPLPGR